MDIVAEYTAVAIDDTGENGKRFYYCEVTSQLTITDIGYIDSKHHKYINMDEVEINQLVEFLKAVGRI